MGVRENVRKQLPETNIHGVGEFIKFISPAQFANSLYSKFYDKCDKCECEFMWQRDTKVLGSCQDQRGIGNPQFIY